MGLDWERLQFSYMFLPNGTRGSFARFGGGGQVMESPRAYAIWEHFPSGDLSFVSLYQTSKFEIGFTWRFLGL